MGIIIIEAGEEVHECQSERYTGKKGSCEVAQVRPVEEAQGERYMEKKNPPGQWAPAPWRNGYIVAGFSS
jgi:hypothetical protein